MSLFSHFFSDGKKYESGGKNYSIDDNGRVEKQTRYWLGSNEAGHWEHIGTFDKKSDAFSHIKADSGSDVIKAR